VENAPGSYKGRVVAASISSLWTKEDWDRDVRNMDGALSILDGLPDVQNAGNAYRDAGIFYRRLGDRLASMENPGNAPADRYREYWYRKSMNALIRCEKIELARDELGRRENARRGKPGLTFMTGALYLEMGRTYARLSDPLRALAALERGRAIQSDPDLLEELAEAYRAAGRARDAARAMVEALAMDSSRVRLTPKLVELYGKSILRAAQ
jgi:tetratricopeptide (TPR) repeat protein